MASNLYTNKVVYGNTTLIDISDTTATASDVASGKTFYLASGQQATGTSTGGDLPAGYTSIPFVEADGRQYLNVNITPTANTSIECAYQFTDTATLQYLFGADYLAYYTTASQLRVYAGNNNYSFTATFSNDWKKIVITPSTATLAGATSETLTITQSASSVSLKLFSAFDGQVLKAKARVSYFKVWDGSTLKRDMIPCTNANSVAGFYDKVSNGWFPSITAYEFIAGKWEDITVGTTPTGTINITANNTYDVTPYASAVVAVPFVTYYTGSSAPASSLGVDGDIYLQAGS